MNPLLSVVIPTFNRRETLSEVLPQLARQSLPSSQYELLLCDSGSTDGTKELLADLAIPNLRHICPPENRDAAEPAMPASKPPWASTSCLRMPISCLRRTCWRNICACTAPGRIRRWWVWKSRWTRSMNTNRSGITPTTRDVTCTGARTRRCPGCFFLTGNASAPRQALIDVGLFDENFTIYGHEDLEFGYRLQKAGYPILYNAGAVNYHWHPVSFEERCDKMRHSGAATRRFYEKHNDYMVLLRLGVNPVTLGLHALISGIPSWQEKLRSKTMQTGLGRELTLQYYYLCGYRNTTP